MRDYVAECLMWFTVVQLLNILIVCLFFFHLILFALVTKKKTLDTLELEVSLF